MRKPLYLMLAFAGARRALPRVRFADRRAAPGAGESQHADQPEHVSGSAVADGRAAPWRTIDGRGRRAHAAQRVLHGHDRRRRLQDRELRHHVDADHRRPDRDGIDWRHRRLRFEPERGLRRDGQRSDPLERHCRPRHVQVDGCGAHVEGGRVEGRRPDRPGQDSSEESRHRVRRGARQSVRLGTRARRLSHEGRRRDVGESALPQRSNRRRVRRHQLVESQRALRGRMARAAQALDDHQRRPGERRRRVQDHRRRRSLDARQRRLP